jgi:hypothetical protein
MISQPFLEPVLQTQLLEKHPSSEFMTATSISINLHKVHSTKMRDVSINTPPPELHPPPCRRGAAAVCGGAAQPWQRRGGGVGGRPEAGEGGVGAPPAREPPGAAEPAAASPAGAVLQPSTGRQNGAPGCGGPPGHPPQPVPGGGGRLRHHRAHPLLLWLQVRAIFSCIRSRSASADVFHRSSVELVKLPRLVMPASY